MIFVSYRRKDAFPVDQLVQALLHRFGATGLFQDSLHIAPGGDFPAQIAQSIARCRLMVVVIGPNWAGEGDKAMKHCPDDWVRREIELAIAARRPLLPVLLGDAQLPRKEDIPASLLPLLDKHALPLRAGQDTTGDLRRVLAAAGQFVPRDWGRVAREAGFMLAGISVAIGGAAWLSSKTLATDYGPGQWPNVLIGLALGLALPLIAAFAAISREWSAKWRPPRVLYRQPALLFAWLAGAVVLVCAIVWPGVRHIDELYEALETTRAETPRLSQKLEAVKAMPRYAASVDVRILERALFVRSTRDMTEDQANETLNFFAPYLQHADTRVRLWARLLSAEVSRQTDRKIELYAQVANDTRASRWQRWYAYMDLGVIYYTEKRDPSRARGNWEEALKYFRTRGLLENLAILEQNERRWDKAAERFGDALVALEDYKRRHHLATLADQEAVLYANWCNMLRTQANSSGAGDPAALRKQALEKCRQAIAAYTPYLDAHWNLARVQLDAGEFDEADETLRKALETIENLSRTSPESLRRFGYAEYGDRYTVWLMVVSRFRSKRRLEDDMPLLQSFTQTVVRLGKDPLDTVSGMLAELEKRNLDLEEDKAALGHMRQARYLTTR